MKQSGFRFSNPVVSKIDYQIHSEYKTDGTRVSIENAFKTNINRAPDSCSAVVELIIKIGDTDQTVSPFHIELVIGASFKWDATYNEETVSDLLSINAPALLLGYARPIVATITSMSPYPTYNIPFYNFTV